MALSEEDPTKLAFLVVFSGITPYPIAVTYLGLLLSIYAKIEQTLHFQHIAYSSLAILPTKEFEVV